jgi:two-component system cell cycle response regulator
LARISDLSPKRLAALLGGVSLVAIALAAWSPVAAVVWIVVGTSVASLRHRKHLKMRRRRRAASESKTQIHEEATAPQRRFDTTQINQSPLRGPVLATETEHIDWRQLRRKQETETGNALGGILDLARRAWGCRTVALLLPTPDGSVALRACSSDREGIQAGAKIAPGEGLLGTLLKPEAPATLLELSLPPSTSDLGIYDGGTGPKSLAAVRVTITGKLALAMADHDEPLDHGVLAELADLASAADLLLSRTRDLRVEMRGREVWQRLGQFERTMGAVAKEELAHEELRHFLLQFVGAEAVFFILPEPGATNSGRASERWYAKVVWTLGADCDPAREFRVEVPGRGICAGAMARGEFLQRRLAPREQVLLLGHGEPYLPLDMGGDVLCAPVSLGVDGRPGMLVLFRSKEAYTSVEREIIQTALSSFGQALTRLRGALELEKLATRDGLTGLLNHRTFQSSFRRELLKARRTNSKLALILTDVDFFKKVNDLHGHPAGDAVLRGVAATVQAQLRDEVDIVARYGGEEFVCVLVGTTEQGALETAERIRKAVEESATDIGEPEPKRVTISLGVSVFPDDGNMAEELIERTDQALYRAKHGGRNRVERALSPGRAPAQP